MKRVLVVTALIEGGAGLAMVAVPVGAVRLLLGADISGIGIPLARVAGLALLALAVACWLARYDSQSCAARAVVSGMLVYNIGVPVVLGAAGLQSQAAGLLLWPAVILHTAMTIWSVVILLRKPALNAK